MPRPAPSEYAPYYGRYIDLVPDDDIIAALLSQNAETTAFLTGVPEDHTTILHPPYTWTIRQVLGHLIDSERVFGYRALRFARGDATPLPGFDENAYALHANHNEIPLADHAAEFAAVRHSHVHLFAHFPADAWNRGGVANNTTMSVRALAYALVGHERHHLRILRARLGGT